MNDDIIIIIMVVKGFTRLDDIKLMMSAFSKTFLEKLKARSQSVG